MFLYSLAFKQTNIRRDYDSCFVMLGFILGLQNKTVEFLHYHNTICAILNDELILTNSVHGTMNPQF